MDGVLEWQADRREDPGRLFMKTPIEDTKWAITYGSYRAVQAAFDQIGSQYHEAIWASGVPQRAAQVLRPYLDARAQGLDLGCGSGVLGQALVQEGMRYQLDGIDLSSTMLSLAKDAQAYRHLYQANLLYPQEVPPLPGQYDFVVTMGLVGDYLPYYHVLPLLTSALKTGGLLGLAVEASSTPSYALLRLLEDLNFEILAEEVISIEDGPLLPQDYYFFVARWGGFGLAPGKIKV